jgi:hypothetical protein
MKSRKVTSTRVQENLHKHASAMQKGNVAPCKQSCRAPAAGRESCAAAAVHLRGGA